MPATEADERWRPVDGTRGDDNRIISMPRRPETGAIVRRVLEEIVSQPNVRLAGAARIGPWRGRCRRTATPTSTAKGSTDSSTPEPETAGRRPEFAAGLGFGIESEQLPRIPYVLAVNTDPERARIRAA